MPKKSRILSLLLALSAPFFTPAIAQTGNFEISGACVAEGCFPGDQAGFPIEITVAGKYRLTSDLSVADGNTNAVLVSADNVHIDLNGYTIQGQNVCNIETGTCSPGGTGRGVAVFDDQKGIRIVNGQIDGFGNYCASVGFAGYAENLTVSNCFAGLGAGRGALVEHVQAYNNRYGFDLVAEAIVRSSTSVDNIVNGIQINTIDRRVIIENNQILNNGSSGITARGPMLADNNFISGNSIGISMSGDAAGSKLEGNVIHANEISGLSISNLNGSAGVAILSNAFSLNGPSSSSPQITGADASRVVPLSPNMCNDSTVCD